jgi:hypothetical protein
MKGVRFQVSGVRRDSAKRTGLRAWGIKNDTQDRDNP